MKTRPIAPARIEFDDDTAPPWSPDYADVYHPRIGALEQARHVFLQGNGLPQRWRGRARFTVLETGFGLGNNFLATWDAWRRDPGRCQRLFYVAVELHPPALADLRRAHSASPLATLAAQLHDAWPELTPDLHVIDLDGGSVQLLLAFGDVGDWLPALRLQADAIFLDGFSPARNPAMWDLPVLKAVGRRAAPDATLATWSVAGALRAGLTTAGFEVQRVSGIGGKREVTRARYRPRPSTHAAPAVDCAAPPTDAVVVGAGAAGAAVALALARLGVAVTVLERRHEPALEGSGNVAGLFHGTLHADDGVHARLFRAAALQAQRDHGATLRQCPDLGSIAGLLRLDARPGGVAAMREMLVRRGLPPGCTQALDAAQASALAGVHLAAPAWLYPGGGWMAPAAWVRLALSQPGIAWRANCTVTALECCPGGGWMLRGGDGSVVAQADTVVLANAAGAAALLAPLGHAPWPLAHTHGQTSWWEGGAAEPQPCGPLRLPLAGDGYAIPLPGGGLLCGATRIGGDPQTDAAVVTAAGHDANRKTLQRLAGLSPPGDPQGRAGWRSTAADRLPIAGMLPCAPLPADTRMDQPRWLPRAPGLFVLAALGSRGLTLAPLLGRLVAAQATGTPWPLPQDLADAVDPGRWLVRAARRGASTPDR